MLALPTQPVTELGAAPLLPRSSAAMGRALNLLYSHAAPVSLLLGASAHRLRWAMHDTPRTGWECFGFKLGNHSGALGLEPGGVASLLGERRSDLLPRDLRYVLLADALSPLADALEKSLRLRFEWTPKDRPAADDDANMHRAAFFEADTVGNTSALQGFVFFEADEVLGAVLAAMRVPRRQPRHGLEWLRIPVPFVVGTTQVSLREISSIAPGDIISIDNWAAAGAALLVKAELGGSAGRQLVGLAEGSRITLQQSKDTDMNRDLAPQPAADDNNESANLPLDRLDALEVSLRFEVGELSLTLGELKSIRPGHVFELAQPINRSAVRIVAHGNVLGKGHLVAVGDRLGVRVSEFAPNDA